MKKLSHNPSMSSSSTVSFHANNICSSKSATAAGCLAGILRRILCSRSLPTHPSDHITDASSIACDKLHELESKEKLVEGKVMPMPSIVARLMGLESVPNVIISHTPNSIRRSRSMNSVDCKGSSDHHIVQGGHRRVKSTLSFREMPTFLELENEEFFMLSFENGSETKEKRLRERKCEMGNGELKQRRGEKCKNNDSRAKVTEKNNEGEQKTSNEKKLSRRISEKPAEEVGISVKVENATRTCEQRVLGLVSESDGAKLSRKKKKKKKVKSVEHECSSEESSPVSVLDFDKFLLDREFPTSELDSDSVESNSRRKLSPEPENYEWLSRIIPDDRKTKKTDGKCVGSRKIDCNNQNYLDMCEQICKMTEAEIVEESNWIYRRGILKHEDFEDIWADFGSEILDLSLDELVHQLIELPFENFNM